MSNVVDLEEVSTAELFSDVDGSISISDVSDEKSDDNLDADEGEEDEFSDIDKTSTSSENEEDEGEGEGEDVEVEEEDPWVMMDADQDEIASSKDPLVKLSDDDDEDWDLEEHAGEDWDLEEHMEALDGSIDLNSKTPIVIKTPLSFEIDTASLDPFKDQWGFYNN